MSKKYIDKEEWVERLEKELSTCKNEKRKEYLTIWINAIKCQPTLDEKEIIRKLMERIVERVHDITKVYLDARNPEESAYVVRKMDVINILKEEGGIDE